LIDSTRARRLTWRRMRTRETINEQMKDLIDERDLARMIGWSMSTIRRHRANGDCPRYLRIGKHIRYVGEDVVRWLENNMTAPAALQ
jgi:predicted DNA-binding transcriptional regulator AlpA